MPTTSTQQGYLTYTLPGGAKLSFAAQGLLYVGPVADNVLHQHYLLQLILSLGETYTLETADYTSAKEEALLIGSEVPHRLHLPAGQVALLFINPISGAGRMLRERYLQKASIAATTLAELVLTSTAPELLLAALDSWAAASAIGTTLDARVQQVLELVAQNPEQKYSLAFLADAACLSESRLTHLFKQETGVAIRHYLQWQKLQQALRLLAEKQLSLTEAAHAAGFSDSAHFSRTFKTMVGMAPSAAFAK